MTALALAPGRAAALARRPTGRGTKASGQSLASPRFPQHCGGFYHRECWEECATSYGGCAVFGCESRRCREVSAAGFVLRILRLVLAAIVFPPRLIRAIASDERSEQRQSIWARSLRYAKLLDPRSARGVHAVVCFVLYLIALGPVIAIGGLTCVGLAMLAQKLFDDPPIFLVVAGGLAGLVVTVAAAVFAPVPFGFLLALGYYFMWFVASVLRSEFALLGRVDQGGATVLGRMRAGGGKKGEACC